MSESSDYTPSPWAAGHDFKSAKKAYTDAVVGRSYRDAMTTGKTTDDVLPDGLICPSEGSLTIIVDVTGSMGEWPATMFSKLPYLEHETKEYLGDDTTISFGAVGDAVAGDRFPVQARPFVKGEDLKDEMEKLVVVGGGGGGMSETYELAALYYARNVSMEKAINPILILIGDEGFYDTIAPDYAKNDAKVILPSRIATTQVFEELKQKYAVYLIRKPYGGGSGDINTISGHDKDIHERWATLLGEDHIVYLPKADRVVDVIFGILARETGRINYFRKELEDRQEKDKVDIVYKSLKTVHTAKALPDKKKVGNSKLKTERTDAAKTKSLL